MKIICCALFFVLVLSGVGCSNASPKDLKPDRNSSNETSSASSETNKQTDVVSAANASPTAAADKAETAQESTPEAVVKELYKQHDAENSPFFQTEKREYVDKFFVKNLADMIWKDSVNSKGEVGALDFDPLYNGQDFEISEFKVGAAEVKGEKANVKVEFLNFGEAQSVIFRMAKEKGVWKIEDIDYGDFTLIGIFKENG
ncbi:MAG: DUF3828 domain-containing protein [Pyrinomonadaceae bacterium]